MTIILRLIFFRAMTRKSARSSPAMRSISSKWPGASSSKINQSYSPPLSSLPPSTEAKQIKLQNKIGTWETQLYYQARLKSLRREANLLVSCTFLVLVNFFPISPSSAPPTSSTPLLCLCLFVCIQARSAAAAAIFLSNCPCAYCCCCLRACHVKMPRAFPTPVKWNFSPQLWNHNCETMNSGASENLLTRGQSRAAGGFTACQKKEQSLYFQRVPP